MTVGSTSWRPVFVLVFVGVGCSGSEAGKSAINNDATENSGGGGTSSSATNGDGTSSNTSGTNNSTSGANTVGSSATSGSTTGGNPTSSGSGGSTTSGSTTSGGGAGGILGENQCRSVEDCPLADEALGFADTRCASPHQPSSNTLICGAPDWCGQCDCPTQAPAPEGVNTPCETDDDCFAWGDTPNAALCRSGQCVVCQTDEDCSAELPRCGSQDVGFGSSFMTCLECATDDDCSAGRPRCVYVDSVGPSCVECFNTSDCETGICSNHACVPGCSSDDDCPDPATGCSDRARCEAIDCSSNGVCPPNTSCASDVCARRPCSVDSDCEGVCVNGSCYESYGTCLTTYAAP